MRKEVIALLALVSACAAPATPAPAPSPISPLRPSPTPLLLPSPTPTPSPTPIIHVVQPGDTLAAIAALYGTTADAICAFNELPNCSLIHPGDELLIPGEGVVLPPTTPILTCGPDVVSWEDAGNYIGQYGVVEGVIVLASYRPDVGGEPTFLNFHDPYEGYFTALIWGDDRAKFVQEFGGPPEEVFLHKTVCGEGLIEEYRGSPEIVLDEPSQIWFAQPAPSPAVVPPEAPLPTPTPTPTLSRCPEGCTYRPPGCYLKGEISRAGDEIYYLLLDLTNWSAGEIAERGLGVLDPPNERWFCTEEEAIANGWPRPGLWP